MTKLKMSTQKGPMMFDHVPTSQFPKSKVGFFWFNHEWPLMHRRGLTRIWHYSFRLSTFKPGLPSSWLPDSWILPVNRIQIVKSEPDRQPCQTYKRWDPLFWVPLWCSGSISMPHVYMRMMLPSTYCLLLLSVISLQNTNLIWFELIFFI